MEEWTAKIVLEEDCINEGEWYWGDPYCKTRKRKNYIRRKFYTNPPPPVSNELFKVRTLDGEDVICYSANGCLYEKEPDVLAETQCYLSPLEISLFKKKGIKKER